MTNPPGSSSSASSRGRSATRLSNKLRRSPSLREVPLVLISSEETLATFEQHKKLKSRADEYLLKPLDARCSSQKVDRPGGLRGAVATRRDPRARRRLGHRAGRRRRPRNRQLRGGRRRGPHAAGRRDARVGRGRGDKRAHIRARTRAAKDRAPFEGEKFDPATQAAFAALEAGFARDARRRATTWSTCATSGRTTICPRTWAGSSPRGGARPTRAAGPDRSRRPTTIPTPIAPARPWGPSDGLGRRTAGGQRDDDMPSPPRGVQSTGDRGRRHGPG